MSTIIGHLTSETAHNLQQLREYYPELSDMELIAMAINLFTVIELQKHETMYTVVIMIPEDTIRRHQLASSYTLLG